MKGNFGRAFKVILGVIGASFFAAAFRRLLNFNGNNHLANAGVSLASAVILYAGLKAFKFTQAANSVLVGGLIVAGMALLAKPVTDAGEKVGAWMRGFGNGSANGNGQPALQTQDMPAGYQEPQTFAYSPSPGIMPAAPAPAPAPAPQQQPQQVVIHQQAPQSNQWLDLASVALQTGGQVLGAYLGGSAGDPNDAFAKLTY